MPPAFVAAGLVLLNALSAAVWLPESLAPERRSRGAIRPQLNPLAALTALLARPGLRPVLAVTFLVATAFAGLQTNLAVFLSDRFGWGPAEVAWVFAVWALASVLMQVCLVGRLSSRLGDIALLVLGFGLTSLSALGIGLAGSRRRCGWRSSCRPWVGPSGGPLWLGSPPSWRRRANKGG